MTNELQNKTFHDETKARQWLESHLWPDGPVCGHCGSINDATAIETRPGLYQCNAAECRSQFTVTVGTLFERSHIPLTKWLMAAFLVCSSKKAMSALQMSRIVGISYKSTWFMMHRIREAMRDGTFPTPIGGQSSVVEADETYVGGKAKNRAYKPEPKKQIVMSLVERGGEVRSFHIKNTTAKTLREVAVKVASRKSYLMTDENAAYTKLGEEYAGHGTVNHSANEYARLEGSFTSIRPRIISRSSSVVYMEPITTSASNILTAIWRNSISVITTVAALALMTAPAPTNYLRASPASV